MKVRLVDPMPLHPSLCYPGTSRPLVAVGLSSNGLPIWPLLGGDGEDEGGDEGEGEDGDEEDSDEEDSEDDSEDRSTKSKKRKSGPVSREEFDAVTRRLSAADKRRSDAEKEAAALKQEKDERERKEKPELENLRKDLQTITTDHEKLQERFTRLALENAFHTASAQAKISWHDPKVALRSADLEDLEIDEKGNVEGIVDVVKTLAKSKKFLVNNGTTEEEEEEDKSSSRRRGASGSGVGSTKTTKGKKNNGQISDDELRKRFPALGRTR